ncbi:LysR family transcriptional regulator, partial [Sutterella massiliensis]|nr:LysR family transcriptional regulator [Sutterella massiliensis]
MPKTDLSGDDLRFILDLSKTKSLTITAANFGWSIPTASR